VPRKSRKKSSKTTKGVPLRVKLLAIFLVVSIGAGIGSVKLFKTTRGKIILLDAGLTDYYSMVQQEIDIELRGPLEALGFDRTLERRMRTTTVDGQTYRIHDWEASCPAPCSPAKIGLAFTKAAKQNGAVARSKLEEHSDGSETILITVGSRRFPTHQITVRQPAPTARQAASPPQARGEGRPRVAIVIDDFGQSRSETVQSFLSLDFPVTISVLPSLPRSRYVLERAIEAGKETMLHLPMEADGADPPSNSVTTRMSDDEIQELLEAYLDESGGITGVNNHQGSRATRDRRVMLIVISVLKRRDLFFLDSLTSAESIAYNTARSLEVPTAKNNLFLDDNTEDPVVIEDRLLRLVEIAKNRGSAIGIGHPKPWTLEAITKSEKRLRALGVDFVFVSELVE